MDVANRWAKANAILDKPWLIVGKGPTFFKLHGIDQSRFHILALNHVAREVRCDVALMMDYDVFLACGHDIASNARFVFMPWRPHVNSRPSSKTLADFAKENDTLAELEREGRLIVFNAQTAQKQFSPHPGEPVTAIKFFSAEAGLNVLADNGVRHIRTLGIDGGAQYSSAFADLNDETLLANGQVSFDKQFGQFAATLQRYPDLIFGPLNIQTPVRIFIGCDRTQALGAKLFEYSVRRHASMSTRFEIIDNTDLPKPKDPQRRARTGFSFSRFKIPERCGYRGRAIYVDADMQVFHDIKDLWTRPFDDAWVLYSELKNAEGRVPQYSVMLMDCANLDWRAADLLQRLDSGEFDYKSLMFDFAMMPTARKKPLLEFEWNSLEHFEPGRTKLIHYTDMPTQPWVSNKNANGEIWYQELRQALADGFVSIDEIHQEMTIGHVSPQLTKWAKLPAHPTQDKLPKNWEPPYKQFAVKK